MRVTCVSVQVKDLLRVHQWTRNLRPAICVHMRVGYKAAPIVGRSIGRVPGQVKA
jgi:hypothetical protein